MTNTTAVDDDASVRSIALNDRAADLTADEGAGGWINS